MIFNKYMKLLCCLTTFLAFGNVVRCEPKVKMLHVLFRHGEKIPHVEYQNYPNDPHGNRSFYPIADGGLTNEGKRREYNLGKMLRNRYDDFFGPLYSPDEIYARSSDIPRAQMSLQLVLAALFPPVGQQIWNPSLRWQPITTYFEPMDKDLLFFPHKCPLYKVEHRNFLAKEETQRLIDKYNSTMEYLTKHSGKRIDTPDAVSRLYHLFKEEKLLNLTLPEWTSEVYPNPMKNITILNYHLRSGTTKLKRLAGGIMLRRITEDMKNLCDKTLCPRGRKASFFSGHEFNMACLAHTLGTNESVVPGYGSAIIIETLQDNEENGSYFVRVLLWLGSESEKLIVQKIPGCGEFCPMGKFLGLLKDVTPDQYEYKCCVERKSSKKNSGSNLSSENISLMSGLPIIIALYSALTRCNYPPSLQ